MVPCSLSVISDNMREDTQSHSTKKTVSQSSSTHGRSNKKAALTDAGVLEGGGCVYSVPLRVGLVARGTGSTCPAFWPQFGCKSLSGVRIALLGELEAEARSPLRFGFFLATFGIPP